MNIQPEHELTPEVNVPAAPAVSVAPSVPAVVPTGWTKMYSREGKVRLVEDADVDSALRDGLLTEPFDLDNALAEFNAAIEDARVSVPKAVAEAIATGFVRDEDSWILNHTMARVRDTFAAVIFSAGAVLPTEADIHALREYLDEEPHRQELRAQVAALHASGEPVPEGLEKNANGSSHYEDKAVEHAKALANLDSGKHAARLSRSADDKALRDATQATTLNLRVRSLQIAWADSKGKAGAPVEIENGVMMRRDLDTGKLRPADPNTGEFLA